MKNLILLSMLLLASSSFAQAAQISANLNEENMRIEKRLDKGDILILTYDLKRSKITRASEWQYYALFCYVHGAANASYNYNHKDYLKKLPLLASEKEYSQDVVQTDIHSRGLIKINEVSPFYAGSVISCGLYPKFGD